MTNQFKILSQELIKLKESEEYLEQDIKRFKQTMCQLNEGLEQLTEQSAIESHMGSCDLYRRKSYSNNPTIAAATTSHM